LDEMREWLDGVLHTVPPQSLTGKALAYLDGQWPKLERVLEDGRLPLDTNAVENAIRPFVIWCSYCTPCSSVRKQRALRVGRGATRAAARSQGVANALAA